MIIIPSNTDSGTYAYCVSHIMLVIRIGVSAYASLPAESLQGQKRSVFWVRWGKSFTLYIPLIPYDTVHFMYTVQLLSSVIIWTIFLLFTKSNIFFVRRNPTSFFLLLPFIIHLNHLTTFSHKKTFKYTYTDRVAT